MFGTRSILARLCCLMGSSEGTLYADAQYDTRSCS